MSHRMDYKKSAITQKLVNKAFYGSSSHSYHKHQKKGRKYTTTQACAHLSIDYSEFFKLADLLKIKPVKQGRSAAGNNYRLYSKSQVEQIGIKKKKQSEANKSNLNVQESVTLGRHQSDWEAYTDVEKLTHSTEKLPLGHRPSSIDLDSTQPITGTSSTKPII